MVVKGLASTVAWRYVPHTVAAADDAALRQAAWAAMTQTNKVAYAKTLIDVLTEHGNDPRVKALLIDPTPWGAEALMGLSKALDGARIRKERGL